MDFIYGTRQHKLEKLFRIWRTIPNPLKKTGVDFLVAAARANLFFMTGPVRLILYVTGRCTRRCSYCFYSEKLQEDSTNDLTLDEISTMAKSMPDGLKVVTITGGEPYLRDDLPDIAAALNKYNGVSKLSINTNGDLPDAAEKAVLKILEITKAYLNLQVSIQRPTDLNGSPGDTLAMMARIADKNSRVSQVSAQTTICRNNLNMLPELMDRIQKMPGVFHKLQFVRSSTDCVFAPKEAEISTMVPPNYESELLTTSDRRHVVDLIENSIKNSRYPLMSQQQLIRMKIELMIMLRHLPLFSCRAGKVDAVVYNGGDVAVCEFYQPFASLRDYGMNFKKIWNCEKIKAQRELTAFCACTHPCNISTSMSYDRTSLRRILLA